MKLSLRAKFLLLSAFVQAVVVALLIGNSLRLMTNAVSRNADRVAHEYAINLNLTLTPYASSGRLGELRSYWSEMLSDPRDSFLRYIVILDASGETVLEAGERPDFMPEALRQAQLGGGVRTSVDGNLLHAQAPLLLKDNQVGMLHFGLSTVDLVTARDDVLRQGGLIALLGFALALLLFFAMTRGVGKRLAALARHSEHLAEGQFSQLPESGGDELEVVTHSLNLMSAALRERIAQLEESQRRLRESEERFRTLFDMTPLPLSVSDQEGRIIAANQALARTFGTPLHELIGRRSDEVPFWASPNERQRIWNEYRLHGVVRGELADVMLPDGGPGQVAIWSSSLLLDGKHAIIWALLDLTQEMKAKQQLRELNDALESRVRERSAALEQANRDLSHALETLQRTQHDLIAAEKMASLGSLVAGIAHELNTPIGNSLLASTALDDRVKEFKLSVAGGTVRRSTLNHHLEEVQLACGLISSSLEKAASLIASFKQIAVDQTNDQRRRFRLQAVALDTAATYTPRLRRSAIQMEVDVPPELELDSYPGSVYQVFNNLINNALMHAFEDRNSGHLWLSARAVDGRQVEIVFRDDGAGMPEDVQRKVFDPFFTTKMGNGGTGLGMNIVYNIVTGVMGGRITIDSAPGKGTTVRIVIPSNSPQRD
ncbi:ATP-binding protein [Pseudoduganella sp. S-14]|uniref:ATP-binding protein n=1 Tax=Pseudoduganella sp. S-14 TaxID=3404065 RepID=UPI003CF4AE4A